MLPARTRLRYEIAAAIGVALLIYVAFLIVGFLGVGCLGVLIAFIAVQADLDKDQTSSVLAMRASPPQRMNHAEKAARRAENNALAQPILIGRLLGAVLAAIASACSSCGRPPPSTAFFVAARPFESARFPRGRGPRRLFRLASARDRAHKLPGE